MENGSRCTICHDIFQHRLRGCRSWSLWNRRSYCLFCDDANILDLSHSLLP